jgi:hypothetical protein
MQHDMFRGWLAGSEKSDKGEEPTS